MIEKPSKILVTLGKRIRSLRMYLGLTQQVLAERADVSVNYLSELERGLRNPTVTTLHRLMEQGLETDLSSLFPSAELPDQAWQVLLRDYSDEERKRLGKLLLSLTEHLKD